MSKCIKCGKPIRNNRSICTYCDGYMCGIERGRADRDKEIAEHNVFFSNKPIEDIVLDARADERTKVLEECARIIERSKTLYENHQTETVMMTKDKCIAMIRNLKSHK